MVVVVAMMVMVVVVVVVNAFKGAKSSAPSVFQHGSYISLKKPSSSVTCTVFFNTPLSVYFSSEIFSIVLAPSDTYVSLQWVNTARRKEKLWHVYNKSLQCFDKSEKT